MRARGAKGLRTLDARESRARRELGAAAPPSRSAWGRDGVEQGAFWALVTGLAWLPCWYGSNDLIAWGVNAIIFPGLAAIYEISLLVRGRAHPIGIRSLAVPAALFGAVVVFIVMQTVTSAPAWLQHPVWGMAVEALHRPLPASISVNRDLTALALLRLVTAASVFWLALQLMRSARRAILLMQCLTAIVAVYAAYGIVVLTVPGVRVPWLAIPSATGLLSSTFINHNSFATYGGIGLVAACGLVLRLYRHKAGGTDGPWRWRVASFIEITGRSGATLLGMAFLILVAVLLTGSRGGIAAAGLGLLALGVLTSGGGKSRSMQRLSLLVLGAVVVGAMLLAYGDAFFASIAENGVGDSGRLAVYAITLRSILDAPLLGFGYGTFADVFPLYRDLSIPAQGVWEQAHDTYLEVFQGLGLVFGSMLLVAVALLVLRCLKGATGRRENMTVPRIAASAAILVGFHALVDFSLQIQAVALTLMAVLGAGVAQSESSRRALAD